MKTLLLFLLVVSFAPVASAQSPPARAPLPPGVQQMLNTPVWYLNYRITIKSGGSYPLKWGGQGTVSEDRFTSGTILLGLRLQGPSFSSASIAPLNTPEAFDYMIGNFANWMSGMSPDESKTDQENDAAMLRVMEQNRNAFARYSYQHHGPSGVGGTDRSSYSGSGTVHYTGTPAMEFDAANRKFRLVLDLKFGDSPAGEKAVTGSGELGIGSTHYQNTRIETGIYGPGASNGPPIIRYGPQNPFEGRIPETFGSISHSSVHDLTDPNSGVKGTLSFEFTLSPFPPEPVELIIEPPANYEKWMPIGGKDEKTEGDFVPIKVTLQKKGGGTPQFKADRFVYWLNGTSREKGVCLNWPPKPETDTPFDLQFDDDTNWKVATIDQSRQSAIQTGSQMLTGGLDIVCFDYGAYADFEAIAVLENGQVVQGVVKGTTDQFLRLPARKPGSLIATAFLDQHGIASLPHDDDDENAPVGDGFKGDGLTLYEEYRGFMDGNTWTPGDPKKKDVFVLNELRYLPAVALGIKHFENATRLKVHSLLRENQVNGRSEINFSRTSGPHVVDQHVIRIVPHGLVSQGASSAQALNIGPPGKAKRILTPPDLGAFRGMAYFAATIAHELLHCVNVFHHGDRDKLVWWYYVPPAEQFYESEDLNNAVPLPNRARTPITVKYENGLAVLPGNFFPAGKDSGLINLGLMQGQHSGAEYCLMRYDNAIAYPAASNPGLRYFIVEPGGTGLCNSAAGTGVNLLGRNPQSRYGSAATPANGGPLVLKNRGNCENQIRVNDNPRAPAPVVR